MKKKFTYFWRSNSPFSNWHPSEFEIEGIKFANMEQYMMWSKAVLMEDYETADKVMKTTDPRACKALGRKVAPFDSALWDENKEEIVYLGCYEKFCQNEHLKKALLETEGELVEASPYDKIWGIGLNEEEAKRIPPERWPGKNLLGVVLTRVKEELNNSEE
jgi:ribA/ribD-fused uncharacterized protein